MNKCSIELINNYSENKRLKIFFFSVFLLVIYGIVLFLNIKTPLLGDDYTYTYIFGTFDKVQNLPDILQSQITHYNTWGGRSVVHTIAQLMLMLNPLVADVINSLVFIILTGLIYQHINYNKPLSISLLIGVFLLLWFFEPFAETILWMTGSANYMWGTVIILAFLLPFLLYENEAGNRLKKNTQFIVMLFFGIIAGWTNENTGAGMILIIILFILYYKTQKWNIPLWAVSGLAGAILGYLIMICAPGNTVRAAGVEMGVISVFYRLYLHTQTLFNFLGSLNLAFVVLFYVVYRRKEKNYKFILYKALIFELGALAAVYVMIFSPSFPERAWFGIITFNIIAVGILLTNINLREVSYIKYMFIVFGLITFALNSYDVVKDVTNVENKLYEREIAIRKAVVSGEKVITINAYYTKTKYSVADPIYAAPMLSIYNGIEIKYK